MWLWCVFAVYLAIVILIGWIFRGRMLSSNQYLNASSSLPTWAVALSFLAYNCGSIEVLGMSAMAAQYGVQALHFYWVGGIPGMIFMAVVVLPLYMRTGARSLPEYLEMRFGPGVRLLSASLSALATAGFAGVTLYGLAHMLHVLVGWTLLTGTLIAVGAVLVYVSLGGVRATVYTSVFQFCVLSAGLAPLLLMTVHFTPASFLARSARWHLWRPLPLISPHATLDRFGVVVGLGFVISFSYWCTDFVMIQRALTAQTIEAARTVPILAGFGKSAVALFVVLPAVAAPVLLSGASTSSFDEVLPRLLLTTYGPVLLAFGAAALLAGLMAGLAGNVSGFAAVFTQEIYRPRLNPGQDETHYLRVGRISVVGCVLLAFGLEYVTYRFRDLMEVLQLIIALSYPPVFAVLVAGTLSRRVKSRAAVAGVIGGVIAGLSLQAASWAEYLRFGSQMSANFYIAALDFSMAIAITYSITVLEMRHSAHPGASNRTIGSDVRAIIRPSEKLLILSALLLGLCLLLNVLWW